MANKIQDVINKKLKGETQKNALDFIAHIETAKFTVNQNDPNDESGWNVPGLCFIVILDNDDFLAPWTVWLSVENLGEKLANPVEEDLKNFAWNNVSPCGSCGGTCTPGTSTTIFGKVFENVCNHNLMLTNPDAEAVGYMKKIVDIKEQEQ